MSGGFNYSKEAARTRQRRARHANLIAPRGPLPKRITNARRKLEDLKLAHELGVDLKEVA